MTTDPVPGAAPAGTLTGTELRRAFRDLPQPVAVVTGVGPTGEPVGMTVSTLTLASLAPPLVLFCPALTSRAWSVARRRGAFTVNILGRQQRRLAVRFAEPGDRFAGVRTQPVDGDLPALADAMTVLVCDVHEERPAGDHTVVLGRIRTLLALNSGPGLDSAALRDYRPSAPFALA